MPHDPQRIPGSAAGKAAAPSAGLRPHPRLLPPSQQAVMRQVLQLRAAGGRPLLPSEQAAVQRVLQLRADPRSPPLRPSEEVAMWDVLQRRAGEQEAPSPETPHSGGLPGPLKAGVEALSGLAMDDVRVHRDSSEPANLGALAFTRGSDIHLGPGQDRHLPHEAWHVVQQRQRRVNETAQIEGGVAINDNPGLEREADLIGARLSSGASGIGAPEANARYADPVPASAVVVQRQEITLEAAEAAMAIRAAAFFALPHEILTPWGNEPEKSNCHGYTVHGVVDRWIDGWNLLAQLGDRAAIVFVRDGAIAHSARPEGGGEITHFLIGVGITRSTIGAGLAGYPARYTLPAQRNALDTYLEQAAAERALANALPEKISEMVSAIYRALSLELDGAQALSERIFALQDNEKHADKDQIIADFDAFAEAHPEIMED